ncbi:MAG: cytochrome c oxidase subunit 3 [Pseudomonadales bacterium]
MTIAVVIFASLILALVGWLFAQSLHTRPWVAQGPAFDLTSPSARSRQLWRVTLMVIMAVVASVFGLFMSAYLIRMDYGDWRPLQDPALLWANTGVLVLCSVLLQLAWGAARRGQDALLKLTWLGGGAMSLVFIGGQYVVWRQLNAAGFYLDHNPASAFFFVLTGLHVLHLLGGLVAWGRTTIRMGAGGASAGVRLGIELCALYWHFLLAVWAVLFALLSTT